MPPLPLSHTIMDNPGALASRATYADVLLGYEVLNEPEGNSWEARLYWNYM